MITQLRAPPLQPCADAETVGESADTACTEKMMLTNASTAQWQLRAMGEGSRAEAGGQEGGKGPG